MANWIEEINKDQAEWKEQCDGVVVKTINGYSEFYIRLTDDVKAALAYYNNYHSVIEDNESKA